jgi:hypothetical protein
MTGLVRKATLLSACGLLMAAAAMAGIPHPGNSSFTEPIVIADVDNAGAACHTASFIIRDANNDPVPGGDVTIEFATCAGSNLPLVCLTQGDPGVIVSSINKTVSKSADGVGFASFRITGTGSQTDADMAGAGSDCVRVYANSVLMWTLKWNLKRYDFTGNGQVLLGADGPLFIDRSVEGGGLTTSNLWGDYGCSGATNLGADGPLFLDASDVLASACTGPTW